MPLACIAYLPQTNAIKYQADEKSVLAISITKVCTLLNFPLAMLLQIIKGALWLPNPE